MANNSSITLRVDPEDKRRLEQLFDTLGLNMTTAVNMFFKQTLLHNGLPFEVTAGSGDDEYFYSSANMEHIRRSIAQLEAGKCREHELIEVDEGD